DAGAGAFVEHALGHAEIVGKEGAHHRRRCGIREAASSGSSHRAVLVALGDAVVEGDAVAATIVDVSIRVTAFPRFFALRWAGHAFPVLGIAVATFGAIEVAVAARETGGQNGAGAIDAQ